MMINSLGKTAVWIGLTGFLRSVFAKLASLSETNLLEIDIVSFEKGSSPSGLMVLIA